MYLWPWVCLQISATVNSAVVYIGVQISLWISIHGIDTNIVQYKVSWTGEVTQALHVTNSGSE